MIRSEALNNTLVQELVGTELNFSEAIKFLMSSITDEAMDEDKPLLRKIYRSLRNFLAISSDALKNIQNSVTKDLDESTRKEYWDERFNLIQSFFKEYEAYIDIFKEYTEEMKTDPEKYKSIDKALLKQGGLNCQMFAPVHQAFKYKEILKKLQDKQEFLDSTNKIAFAELSKKVEKLLAQVNTSKQQESRGYQFGDITVSIASTLFSYFSPAPKSQVVKDKEDEFVTVQKPEDMI